MAAPSQGKPLDVAIIGAGIGGLITAIALRTHGHGQHRVTVFERSPSLQALGAPIQITPNGSRILIRYGLGEVMESIVPEINALTVLRSYQSGQLLTSMSAPKYTEMFGSPLWTLSRYRLVEALLAQAKALGVQILFSKCVVDVTMNSDDPVLLTADGETYQNHLVIGADGMGSYVRKHVLGQDVRAANPCSAFSINIPRHVIRRDPELAILFHAASSWLGPGRLIVAIDMPDMGDVCNFVLASEHEDGKQGEWYTKGDLSTLRDRFSDFEPRVQKFLELADPDECYLWKFSDLPTLETWQGKNGRVILVGDAAHAALPNSGMGATSCIEDSQCLAECLSHVQSVSDLPAAMEAFETIRKPRTSFIAETGRRTMKMAHLPDGPEQQARDDKFMNPPPRPAAAPAKSPHGQPQSLKDYDPPKATGPATLAPAVRKYTFGYDVLDHTRDYFKTGASTLHQG